MAKKFNNGQTFGEIRQILNDNADEINANATAASDAKTIAEQLAGNNTAGRAISTSTKTSNPVVIPGNISFNQGMGITNVKKLNTGARLTDFIESDVDVLWFLKGVYAGAWKTGTLNGIAFLGPNGIIAFDYDTCEMWIYGASRKWQKAGGADHTLPVASANTLGGIKVGSGLKIASDGTLSTTGGESAGGDSTELITTELRDNAIPKPTPDAVKVYTFEGYKEGMPTKLKGFPFSGVLTVYPNGLLTMLVTGFYEDPTEQEGAPYLSMNGLWTYTGGVGDGWHKNYEVSFPATMTKTDTGKEVKNRNGK